MFWLPPLPLPKTFPVIVEFLITIFTFPPFPTVPYGASEGVTSTFPLYPPPYTLPVIVELLILISIFPYVVAENKFPPPYKFLKVHPMTSISIFPYNTPELPPPYMLFTVAPINLIFLSPPDIANAGELEPYMLPTCPRFIYNSISPLNLVVKF